MDPTTAGIPVYDNMILDALGVQCCHDNMSSVWSEVHVLYTVFAEGNPNTVHVDLEILGRDRQEVFDLQETNSYPDISSSLVPRRGLGTRLGAPTLPAAHAAQAGGWDKVSKSRDQRAHFTPSLVKECDFSDQQRSDLAQ